LDRRLSLRVVEDDMNKTAWFCLGLFWGFSLLVCLYGLLELSVWMIETGDEPIWLKPIANLMGSVFRDSGSELHKTIEVLVTGLIAIAIGALSKGGKSLIILIVCTLFVVVGGVCYFLFSDAWALYGGAETVAASKAAFAAVVQLNILLLGAHMGITIKSSE
jgi:hypothetical protein